VFLLHMGLSLAALATGQFFIGANASASSTPIVAGCLLTIGALLRSGICPLHCWMTDLFEKATFGTALLFVMPMTGVYAVMRLVFPIAPTWALQSIAVLSLATAVYAAGMAMVQHESRRFFCYLFLSHSSLVLVGLEVATPIGLTGALCVWLSVGISLLGFGLALRSVEARTGRLSLDTFHGLYEHTPFLAGVFLLTGLASIGFPGTVGFVGTELLIEGAIDVYPLVGFAVVFAAMLNGISVVRAYFHVFTGTRHQASVSMACRPAERAAILAIALVILLGGMAPQPGVASRYHAATEIMLHRERGNGAAIPQPETSSRHSPRDLQQDPPESLADFLRQQVVQNGIRHDAGPQNLHFPSPPHAEGGAGQSKQAGPAREVLTDQHGEQSSLFHVPTRNDYIAIRSPGATH
jgi:NADH-quinone oxidoreductase subunit M